jgi:UDP-N-acetylmuramoyl-L-alanyl-D-glutamate--2,6-diaminopimelate ligase
VSLTEGRRIIRIRKAGRPMDLSNLKAAIGSVYIDNITDRVDMAGAGSLEGRIRSDSRQVQAGDIFVAVRGVYVDGHDFIEEAVKRGAGMIVAEEEVILPDGVALVRVENSAQVLGWLAQRAWGAPASEMQVLGITGTNGKTTVSYLTRAILQAAGKDCGIMGTVGHDVGSGVVIGADNTTPGPLQIAELMAQMRDNGLAAVVMECSSHGLDQQRTAGIDFAAAAFTNLSGDHLDYHRTEQEYLEAKSKLFVGLDGQAVAILNAQDKASEYISGLCPGEVWWYGIDTETQICGKILGKGLWGSEFELKIFDEAVKVRTGLIGEHNVSNCLAAAGLARATGASLEAIGEGIGNLTTVPGRLERVEAAADEVTVFVDYAHTDDALEHALETVRGLAEREVIVVFGCGGNRDRTKRGRMARVAQKWADRIVVTNDNPRREDPLEIIAEIRAGFSAEGREKVTEIPDRLEAISHAIIREHKGDVVLIAGKGHEDYQIIGDVKRPFDDREVVREILGIRDRDVRKPEA